MNNSFFSCFRRFFGENLRGFTLAEFSIFLTAVLIPVFFLIYYSPAVASKVGEYRCRQNMREIYLALQIYAGNQPDQSFPSGANSDDVARKIFTRGMIADPSLFDDPRLANGKAAGTPGPFFQSSSHDFKGGDYLFNLDPLTLDSDPQAVLLMTQPVPNIPGSSFLLFHVDGSVSTAAAVPAGNFA